MRAILRNLMATLVVVCTFGLSSAQASPWPDDDWQAKRLEGTWVFQITLQDCSLHTPIGVPFQSFLTFTRGGTVVESTSNPMFFPAVRGPGHGVWSRTGPHTYQAKTIAAITLNGTPIRTQTITQTINLESDDTLMTTSASVKFFNPAGDQIAAGCAAATGKRFELEEAN